MMSDSYIISGNRTVVVRKCPFCAQLVQEKRTSDSDFIVHIRSSFPAHTRSNGWVAYVARINRSDAGSR